MKHHLIALSALCAFTLGASAQTVKPTAPHTVGNSVKANQFSFSRALSEYRLAKQIQNNSAPPIVQDIRKPSLPADSFVPYVPQAEDHTSPMIRKPNARYEYMILSK